MAEHNTDPTVLSFGELLWDLLPSGPILGGSPGNVAYRLEKIGVPSAMISRVGEDEFGKEALRLFEERGLTTRFIQRDPKKPTGTVPIKLSAAGDADFEIIPDVAYDYVEMTDDIAKAARSAKAIVYSTLIQRSPRARETIESIISEAPNALKFLDINLRKKCFSKETIDSSLRNADILKLNHDEVKAVSEILGLGEVRYPQFATEMLERYQLSNVVITFAANGVQAYSEKGERLYIPGHKVPVSDTVGSGDNFTAGFVARYLKGDSLRDCCDFANLLGALAATKAGGMPSLSEEEISKASFPRTSLDELKL